MIYEDLEELNIGGARPRYWAALIVAMLGMLAWYGDDNPRWPDQSEELPYHCGNPEFSESADCHPMPE